MDLILTNETFNVNNIMIKYSKINQKILYHIDEVYLLGIPLKLYEFKIISENDKTLVLKLKDTNTISILKKWMDSFMINIKININHLLKIILSR